MQCILTHHIYLLGKRLLFFLLLLCWINEGYSQCTMACNDNIQVSLNQHCEAEITYHMVLRDPDNPYVCNPNGPSAYKVVVMDENNVTIPTSPIITCEYIGRTLNIKVKHWYSGNSCWSTAKIEDKLPPFLDCEPVELWCNQNGAPQAEGGAASGPSIMDACAVSCQNLSLDYTDVDTIYPCDSPEFNQGIAARTDRTWVACDDLGNCTSCVQPIIFRVLDLGEITMPADIIGENTLDCGACDPNDLGCTGAPTLHGMDFQNPLCNVKIEYSDSVTKECEGTYTIARMWAIQNTCTNDTRHYTQQIEIMDQTPPNIICSNGATALVIQTDPTPFSCVASIVVPTADITDDCSSLEHISVITKVVKIDSEDPGQKEVFARVENANGGFNLELPFGEYEVYYQATDDCGNVINNLNQGCKIEIQDQAAPTPVCNAITKLSLAADGTGIVFAESFDNGSYDNCCLEAFKVRRMDDLDSEFSDFVAFSCEDATTTEPLMVILRVVDCSGNSADCMVEVRIDDKTPPTIIHCPEPISFSCEGDISLSELAADLMPPEVADPCGMGAVLVELKEDFRNDCGLGAAIFEWHVYDAAGNGPARCEQLVNFIGASPATVVFPGDFTAFACKDMEALNPDETGRPIIEGQPCGQFETAFTDIVHNEGTSCLTLQREWTVTNLCAGPGEPTVFEHTQEIRVEDREVPVLNCNGSTFDVCIEGAACQVAFAVPGVTITDCNSNVMVSAEWLFSTHELCVEASQSGSIAEAANGFTTPNFGPGQLTVTFFANDGCGNVAECQRIYNIKDCEAPTVFCTPGLTLNLDENGQLEIWADDFNQKSEDNCEECPGNELTFSFSQNINNQNKIYTCEDLGVKTAQIWVTDGFGNQNLCEVAFIIKSNGSCDSLGMNEPPPDTLDTMVLLAGKVFKENGTAVESVTISVENQEEETMKTNATNAEGTYTIEVARSENMIVEPSKNTQPLNGVTTFDLVLLRRYLLGNLTLNSPYQMIAADINHSNSISTADLVALRKVILQIEDDFPNNTSWRFIKANYEFQNPTNPFEEEMPEKVVVPKLLDEMNIDFVAIKVGDLNGNALGQELKEIRSLELRNNEKVFFEIKEKELAKGAIETIHFTMDSQQLLGFQFTLNFDPYAIEILEIKENEWINASNFGTRLLERGAITISWDALGTESVSKKLNFQLKVKTKKTVKISDLFSINSRFTLAEAYDLEGNTLDLGLVLTKNKRIFDLFQNQPNPFNQWTVIRFELPGESKGELTIFDLTGKKVKSISKVFQRGANELMIDDLDQRGVFYYQLETDFGTKTAKMIRVK